MKKLGEIKTISLLNLSVKEAEAVWETTDKLLPKACGCRQDDKIDFYLLLKTRELMKAKDKDEIGLKQVCDYCLKCGNCPCRKK